MDMSRLLDVLVVCLPVFAVMGLGKYLGHRGSFDTDRRTFVNWLVYNFALPALIFKGVASQRFASFGNPTLTLLPLAVTLVVGLIGVGVAKLARFKGGFAAAFIYVTFWANVTYMGFPLCFNAFGQPGLDSAAVYNAFAMPFFFVVAFILIGFFGAGGHVPFRQKVRHVVLNPVILAAISGAILALIGESFRDEAGALQLPALLDGAIRLIASALQLVGGMGLPLALLSVGAALHWSDARRYAVPLAYSVGMKLIGFPLIALLMVRFGMPNADPADVGVLIVLGSTPCAVASYVVSCQIGVEEGFVSAMLVVSTVVSVITIPVWLYIVM
jgi:predicted permease